MYLGRGKRCLRVFPEQQYRTPGDFSVTDQFQFLQEVLDRFIIAGKREPVFCKFEKALYRCGIDLLKGIVVSNTVPLNTKFCNEVTPELLCSRGLCCLRAENTCPGMWQEWYRV
jgi:hypothetical protein